EGQPSLPPPPLTTPTPASILTSFLSVSFIVVGFLAVAAGVVLLVWFKIEVDVTNKPVLDAACRNGTAICPPHNFAYPCNETIHPSLPCFNDDTCDPTGPPVCGEPHGYCAFNASAVAFNCFCDVGYATNIH